MTTGVDILFKELPAPANAVDRFSKSDTSASKADRTDERSSLSENNNDFKSEKSFSDHLDDHTVESDNKPGEDNTKNSTVPSNETEVPENSNPEPQDNQPDAEQVAVPEENTAEQQNTENTEAQPVAVVEAAPAEESENNSAPTLGTKNILLADILPEKAITSAAANSAINDDVKNVKIPDVVLNHTANNSPVNNPPLTTAEVASSVQNIIPAVLDNETAQTTVQATPSPIVNTLPAETTDTTLTSAKPAEPTVSSVPPQNENSPSVSTVNTVNTAGASADNQNLSPDQLAHQNGLGKDDEIFADPENFANVQSGKGQENNSQPPSENTILTSQKSEQNSEQNSEQKSPEIITTPAIDENIEISPKAEIAQPLPAENRAPVETVVAQSGIVIPAAPAQSQNSSQNSTSGSKNSSSNNNSATATGQNTNSTKASGGQAAQMQQATTNNPVKSDILFDLGLNSQKLDQALPQNLNLNGSSSLAAGSLLTVQEVNVQRAATTFAASLKTEVPLQAKMINEQITVAINKSIQNGLNNFSIRLHPAELGQVDIRMEFLADGKMQAAMMVENERTLSMLQRDQSALEKALQDAGINLSNKNLNFSLMKQGQQNNGQNLAGLNDTSDNDMDQDELSLGASLQEIRMGYSDQTIDISV